MSHTHWRSTDPTPAVESQRIRPPAKPQRVHLILTLTLYGGPHDGRKASVRADEHRQPPLVLTVAATDRSVYRYSFDRKHYVWWTATPGAPVPTGIPVRLHHGDQ
jgi:hypothetical protein